MDTPSISPIWCAVANIKKEIVSGEEHQIKNGTKHFRGGAIIYVIDAYWGMCNSVTVIGHHRKTGRFITIDLNHSRLEKLRLDLVYSPTVISLIYRHFDSKWGDKLCYSEDYAKKIVEGVSLWEDY